MDHLPAPTSPLPPLTIPFVATPAHDPNAGDFLTFPEHHGLKSGDIRMGIWASPAAAAPFLQAWLYFGLMRAFFGVDIQVSDFARAEPPGGGGTVVDSSALVGYMRGWEARARTLPLGPEELRAYYDGLMAVLDHAYVHNRAGASADPTWAAVSQSVAVLIQNLTDLAVVLLNRGGGGAETADDDGVEVVRTRDYNHVEQPLLERRMVAAGWCPYEVARIRAKDLPCTTVYFLSRMKRDFRGKTHGGCSEAHCGVYEIDEARYETGHVDADCACDHVSPPVRKLREILREGGIPVVACTVGAGGELGDLDVVEWGPGVEYVAFSHVWSDGKGNPFANSLPLCQVVDLCTAMLSLSSTVGGVFPPIAEEQLASSQAPPSSGAATKRFRFWIDTLCIPPEEHHRSLRAKAILRMKEVFANAWTAIVLDAELQKFSGKNTLEETLARIFTSLWMRRCWTLEELAMAQRCFVRFSDAVVDLKANVHPRRDKWPVSCPQGLDFDSNYHYLARQFLDTIDIHHSRDPALSADASSAENFARAWNGMSWRATSRESDRYVILAVLLGLDISVVLASADIEARIRALLAVQRVIPLAIFTLNARKQQCPGFRWAPAQFSPTALDIKPNEWPGFGVVDPPPTAAAGGLWGLNVVSKGVVVLHPMKFHEFYAYKDPVPGGKWYLVQHQALPDDPALARIKAESHLAQLCFIFDVGPACGARLSLLSREGAAAGGGGETYGVRYDCRVGVIEMPPEHLPPGDVELDPRKKPGVGFGFAGTFIPIVAVVRTAVGQRWRIT